LFYSFVWFRTKNSCFKWRALLSLVQKAVMLISIAAYSYIYKSDIKYLLDICVHKINENYPKVFSLKSRFLLIIQKQEDCFWLTFYWITFHLKNKFSHVGQNHFSNIIRSMQTTSTQSCILNRIYSYTR